MKKTNKGFSLVELIIVIAIMAILAGAIAPALIRYIDKSRKSNDVTAAKSIKTAVETALGNEQMYEYLTSGKAQNEFTGIITVQPGKKLTTSTTTGKDNSENCIAVSVDNSGFTGELKTDTKLQATIKKAIQLEVATNIGEKMPKCKYKKNACKPKSDDEEIRPSKFVATVSAGGEISVYVVAKKVADGDAEVKMGYKPLIGKDDDLTNGSDTPTSFKLVPEVSSYYQ